MNFKIIACFLIIGLAFETTAFRFKNHIDDTLDDEATTVQEKSSSNEATAVENKSSQNDAPPAKKDEAPAPPKCVCSKGKRAKDAELMGRLLFADKFLDSRIIGNNGGQLLKFMKERMETNLEEIVEDGLKCKQRDEFAYYIRMDKYFLKNLTSDKIIRLMTRLQELVKKTMNSSLTPPHIYITDADLKDTKAYLEKLKKIWTQDMELNGVLQLNNVVYLGEALKNMANSRSDKAREEFEKAKNPSAKEKQEYDAFQTENANIERLFIRKDEKLMASILINIVEDEVKRTTRAMKRLPTPEMTPEQSKEILAKLKRCIC